MSIQSIQPHEPIPIQIRQHVGSASRRMATIATVASVIFHGGVLTACICLSHNSIRFVNVQRGAAAFENQIMLTASADDPSLPIQLAIQPVWIGSSDLDRAEEETAAHRGIELVRRLDKSVLTSLPDLPQADVAFSTSDSIQHRKRVETLDDLRPSPMQTQRRPRQSVQHLPPPVMMPTVAESGSASWMPKPLESNVPPKYPADALRMRAEGTAQLRITVSREGQVMEIEIQQSSGWPSLDQAAVEAVSKWRFQAQATMFTSSSQSVILPVRFALNR